MSTRALLLAVVALAACAAASPATAATVPVQAEVVGGPLELASPRGAVALGDGRHEIELAIVDARGTGAGWSVGLAVDAPAGAPPVTVSRAHAACGARSTCTLPAPTVELPAEVSSAPTEVFDAARGSGLGSFVVTLEVDAPGGPHAGAFTVASGP